MSTKMLITNYPNGFLYLSVKKSSKDKSDQVTIYFNVNLKIFFFFGLIHLSCSFKWVAINFFTCFSLNIDFFFPPE